MKLVYMPPNSFGLNNSDISISWVQKSTVRHNAAKVRAIRVDPIPREEVMPLDINEHSIHRVTTSLPAAHIRGCWQAPSAKPVIFVEKNEFAARKQRKRYLQS
jgi:hypothetical protein